MAFLLSRIGLVRPRSEMIKIKSNQIKSNQPATPIKKEKDRTVAYLSPRCLLVGGEVGVAMKWRRYTTVTEGCQGKQGPRVQNGEFVKTSFMPALQL
jgi:hypothetical protein